MSAPRTPTTRNPWAWIPTLYFAQGIPYVVVMTMSVILYKRLGVSNAEITFYTSWLNLPWVLKGLWSPVVELFGAKRRWIVVLQFALGLALAAAALAVRGPAFFTATLVVFRLMAFASATHDIAADGFYMLAQDKHDQAQFVGVRSTFYRVAMIAGQGLFVMLAGALEQKTGNVPLAWSLTLGAMSAMFLGVGLYHRWALPEPAGDVASPRAATRPLREFFATFGAFFRKPQMERTLAFLLLYRFAEAQQVPIAQPILLEARDRGGLGLSTTDVGFAYGTLGTIALLAGGILGGLAAARHGLRAWLPWMVVAIHVPNVVFVYLAYAQPDHLLLIDACLALEQFGYGFGFSAYMIYMLYIAQGAQQTSHYAICTGFMALGMMVPRMFAGSLQELLGYQHFFIWVMIATIPGFLVTALIRPDPEFGKKARGAA